MRSRIVGIICLTLLLTCSLSANTRFTGAFSDLWSNADNWTEGLPDPEDKVQVAGGALCMLDYDAGVIKNTALEGGNTTHLRLVDGAQLTVSDWSIIGYAGAPEEPHLLEVLGGVYNADARMFIGFLGSGKLVIDHGGVVNLNAQQFAVGENTDGKGKVEIRGGSLNLLSNSALPLRFRAGANSTASMDFSGGIMTQTYSDARAAVVNDHIADGTITAYGGIGTVVVETTEDNILVVKGLHPLNPAPEDGGNVVPGNITLSWTVPDPCTAGEAVPVDVYFTDDLQALQQFLDPAAIRVLNKQSASSVVVQAEPKTRYYWAVDSYVGSAADPVFGPIFSFIADNIAPRVNAGADVVTWVQDGSSTGNLDATVTDEDAYTVSWTVVSEPNAGNAVIQATDAEDTTVTLSAVGQYVLQLKASDGEYTGSDTVTINVYADSCEAAQSLPDYEPLVGDLNGDCRVDETDLALLEENWLQENFLTEDWFLLP